MPTRPLTLKISGRPYSVVLTDLSAHDAYGLCEPGLGRISLDLAACGSVFKAQDTLLHEVMHAVLRQQGRPYCKAEETYVTALATGVLGALHDNPKLVAYLLDKRKA